MTQDPIVQIQDVHKSFGRLEVLKGITFDVSVGEVVCLLGASGSGKTTLVRCINHLETINKGKILVAGEMMGYRQEGDRLKELSARKIAAQRQHTGMVFQRFNLFPHMTALENISCGPIRVQKRPRPEVEAEARGYLSRVGLANKA
ncbi:MAG: amino acid ABC transporter ATP-binding protein, partial [Mesorhizobium sp.]